MRIIRNIAEEPRAPARAACADLRCGCGSLLARLVGGEVELKCRRCKRVWRLAVGEPGGAPRRRLLEEGTR